MKKLISSDEAKPTKRQHKKPCSDCPFRRDALPGWLGSISAKEWVGAAHAEAVMLCHVRVPQQCAGAAIYRANVCKSPRSPEMLRLPSDERTCFSRPDEFLKHHARESES